MKRVMLRYHSTYTRALLAESILHSQMSIQLSPESLSNIQKTLNKALWKKKNSDDMMIEARHLIAKNRTRAPGGLNLRVTILKAECLYGDSRIQHLRRYYDGAASKIIEGYLEELVTEDLPKMGSQTMLITGKKQTELAPIYTDTILKMASLIKLCEESQNAWEAWLSEGW